MNFRRYYRDLLCIIVGLIIGFACGYVIAERQLWKYIKQDRQQVKEDVKEIKSRIKPIWKLDEGLKNYMEEIGEILLIRNESLPEEIDEENQERR